MNSIAVACRSLIMENEFENTISVLERYAEAISALYKQYLADEGVDSSFNLANSIQTTVKAGKNRFTVEMSLLDYWYYIEEGRKPGKFPPVDAIRNWISVKPVIPQPTELPSGRVVIPAENQLAFLIGRKIANEGIEGKHLLHMASDELLPQFESELINALALDLQEEFYALFRTII